ncbi:MAG: polyphosphate kinase 2 [Proteobacteria bacterium]|nr:polyphosphate kinase 2 [Pseudomonadota bacterium]
MSSGLEINNPENQEDQAAIESVLDVAPASENLLEQDVVADSEVDESVSEEVPSHPELEDNYLGGEYSSATIKKIRACPESISKLFKEGKYPYTDKIEKKTYEDEKEKLQIELLKVQNWVKQTGQKIVIIFEGRDAAGKGGAIKRFTEHLNPRAAKVVALEKPTTHEKGEWYFQRYIKHMPTRGEILFLDRSWYNRAGVERVMGFCDQIEYLEFMRQCPDVERMLVNSDIKLFKYYFSVTKKEQRDRFSSRETDPLKQWKMSPVDKAAVGLWSEYTRAKEAMFFYTDTAAAPWTIIKSDDKKRARLNCMQHFLSKLDYPGKDLEVISTPDPLIVGSPSQVIRSNVHLDDWPNSQDKTPHIF